MTTAVPVPAIDHHALLVLLLQLVLLLLLAVCLGQLAARFRMPAIVGELLAGVLVGPSVLGHLMPGLAGRLLPEQPAQMHLLDAVGQLDVLLLVGPRHGVITAAQAHLSGRWTNGPTLKGRPGR
ncbi:hypothetical protein ACFY15_35380 [Streptomyces sp. NPDC001373]|uniref:hypothetical protein n=1 Tax=Streptomyces sp. NPDC001373 TaxID=3364565 RepID=UPI003675DE78